MIKQWMQKWLDKGLASAGLGALPATACLAAPPGYHRAVPDWQVPAYLRRRVSGDRLRV
jgi:hypothetical protein